MKMIVVRDVFIALMMEALRVSETSVSFYQVRRYIPETRIHHNRGKHKSQMVRQGISLVS
jgi:hypothetical protein